MAQDKFYSLPIRFTYVGSIIKIGLEATNLPAPWQKWMYNHQTQLMLPIGEFTSRNPHMTCHWRGSLRYLSLLYSHYVHCWLRKYWGGGYHGGAVDSHVNLGPCPGYSTSNTAPYKKPEKNKKTKNQQKMGPSVWGPAPMWELRVKLLTLVQPGPTLVVWPFEK